MDFLATWRVIDMITAPTRRIMQAVDAAQNVVDRAGRAMGGTFNRAASSVTSLREQIDKLRTTRDSLRIGVDTTQIANANRQLRTLQGELTRLEQMNSRADGSLSSSSGGLMAGLSRRLLPLFAASTLAAGANGMAESGMQRELTQARYQQFAGKAQGLQVFEQLNQFGNDSIYKNNDVLGSGAKIVEQFGANKALSQIKMYGNLAGGDGEALKGITRTMGQIKGVGRLQGDELNELANHGILGLQEQIAKMKGVSVAMFNKMKEAGEISFMDVQKALEAMTSKGGKYFGYLDTIANTTFGKMQKLIGTIQDKFERFSMSKLPMLNGLLDWVNKFIDNFQPAGDAISNFAKSFSPLFTALRKILEAFGLLPREGDGVIGVINGISVVFNSLAGIVRFVGSVVNNLVSIFQMLPFSDTIAKGIGAYLMFKKFVDVAAIIQNVKMAWAALNASFLVTPIGLIIVGIVALVAALTYAWQNSEKFREVVVRSWEGIKAVWSSISETFMIVWNTVSAWMTKIGQFLYGSWLMIKDMVVRKFYEMYEPVRPYVEAIVRAFNWVKEKVGGIWDWITDKITSAFEKVKEFVKPFTDIIKKVLPFTPLGIAVGAGKMAFDVASNLADKFRAGYNSKAADKAVALANKNNAQGKGLFDGAGAFGGMGADGGADGAGAGGAGGKGSGISDSVEGAKSRTINITVKNLVETINNYVNTEQTGKKVGDDVLDTLNRLLSSGDRLAYE